MGLLRETQPGKYSLAYDLQGPFWFLVDLAVISLIETNSMEKGDLIRMEGYPLRLRHTGARKVTEEVNRWMNKTVEYQGKEYAWTYVLLLKTRELAQDLVGKKGKLDLVSPGYEISRQDSAEIREKILNISYAEWKKPVFLKGALHYIKQNAKSGKPFTLQQSCTGAVGTVERESCINHYSLG